MPIKNALERIEAALHTAHYNARRPKEQDIYTEALQDIADIREAVPDGLGDAVDCYPIANDTWLEKTLDQVNKRSKLDTGKCVVKAAKLLQSITATQHNRDNERY